MGLFNGLRKCYYCKKEYPSKNKALWVNVFCCVDCGAFYKSILDKHKDEGYIRSLNEVFKAYLGFDYVEKVSLKDKSAQDKMISIILKKNKKLTREEVLKVWKEVGIEYKGDEGLDK